jgi:hypothetical protein
VRVLNWFQQQSNLIRSQLLLKWAEHWIATWLKLCKNWLNSFAKHFLFISTAVLRYDDSQLSQMLNKSTNSNGGLQSQFRKHVNPLHNSHTISYIHKEKCIQMLTSNSKIFQVIQLFFSFIQSQLTFRVEFVYSRECFYGKDCCELFALSLCHHYTHYVASEMREKIFSLLSWRMKILWYNSTWSRREKWCDR